MMQSTPNVSARNLVTTANGTVTTDKRQSLADDFKNLLTEALQSTGGSVSKGKAGQAKQARANGQSEEPQTPGAEDTQVQAQAAQAEELAAMAEPAIQPPAETASAEGSAVEATAVQAAAPVMTSTLTGTDLATEAPVLAPTTAATQAAQAVPATETAAAAETERVDAPVVQHAEAVAQTEETIPVQARPQYGPRAETPGQDRFDRMIGQAHQQLQQSQSANKTVAEIQAETEVQTETRIRTEPKIPAETEVQTETGTVLPEPGETVAEPAEGEDLAVSDDVTATEEPAEPVLEEQEPPEEPSAEAPEQETRPMDQRPLREMPLTDRAVLEMQSRRQAAETAQPERAPQPQPAQPQADQVNQPRQQQPPAYQTDQPEQISARIAENIQRDTTEFRMQLRPEELGTVNIRMVIDNGRLAVEIMASGARTIDLLTRQAETLGQTLRINTGMEVSSVQVISDPSTAANNSTQNPFSMNSQAENGGFQGQSNGEKRTASGGKQDDNTPQFTQDQTEEAPNTRLNYTI